MEDVHYLFARNEVKAYYKKNHTEYLELLVCRMDILTFAGGFGWYIGYVGQKDGGKYKRICGRIFGEVFF